MKDRQKKDDDGVKQHSVEKNRRTANTKRVPNFTENVSLVANLVTALENAVIRKLKVFNVLQGEVTKVFVLWLTELKRKIKVRYVSNLIQAPVTIC